ncbi:MAG: GtrA family protein [Mesorhizobium sp.]|nr:GtrA family protein [Mesorhizobium sp.]MBN9241970.1 GtrA family protein [Mesorhizobium sp.]
MRPNRFRDPYQALRFGAVGLLNTALGYAVILAGLAMGWGDVASNATGYAAGLVTGFLLNRSWTFRSGGGLRQACRYMLAFLVCYCANLAVLAAARSIGFVESPFAHLAGIGVYSALFYFCSARYVFAVEQRDGLAIRSRVSDP